MANWVKTQPDPTTWYEDVVNLDQADSLNIQYEVIEANGGGSKVEWQVWAMFGATHRRLAGSFTDQGHAAAHMCDLVGVSDELQ